MKGFRQLPVCDFHVLLALAQADMTLMQVFDQVGRDSEYAVFYGTGTLAQSLARLVAQGLVEAEARGYGRQYRLTETGEAALQRAARVRERTAGLARERLS